MTTTPDVVALAGTDERAQRLRAAIRDRLDDPAVAVVADDADAASAIGSAEVALAFRLSTDQLARAEQLEWVQALNAGVDHYPLDALADRGVILTNASGIHAEPAAEQVLGYLLVFERRIHEGMRQGRAGEWESYEGGELWDDTVGVVGVGAIGERVAELAGALGATVIGTKRDPSTEIAAVDELYGPDGLDEVVARADYLVVACPLSDETRGLIGREAFERMSEDAVLVNVARGPVVDQPALVDALERSAIRGAALDVFAEEPLPADSPLRELPNVVITPHVAGTTPYYYERVVEIFAENYRAYADGDLDGLRNRIL